VVVACLATRVPGVPWVMRTSTFVAISSATRGDLSEQARFHSVWAKRGQGVQFVSWQSTRVPPKQ
jgi:hypothetical protein